MVFVLCSCKRHHFGVTYKILLTDWTHSLINLKFKKIDNLGCVKPGLKNCLFEVFARYDTYLKQNFKVPLTRPRRDVFPVETGKDQSRDRRCDITLG